MPEDWKIYRLGELTTWKSGGTPSKSKAVYWGGDIPWISAKTLNGRYVSKSPLNVTSLALGNGAKMAVAGDVLLLVRGSGLFNDIPVAMAKKNVAFNQDIKCVSPATKELVNIFLLYWFKGKKKTLSSMLEATSIGAGKFDMDRLLDLSFSLPPLHEQKAIASILSTIDDKIELNLQTNKTLEDMAMALYKHWFVDFGPFQDGEFVDSELGKIPKGWEVKRLGEMAKNASVTYDFTDKKSVIFINTGDVLNGDFLKTDHSLVSELPGQAKKSILKDCILYSEIRPKNKRFAYVNFEAPDYVVSTKFMVIKNNGMIRPRLLYRMLRRPQTVNHFNSIAEGRSGTFPQITFDSISSTKFCLPPLTTQKRYQNLVESLEDLQFQNKVQNQTLTQLRDTLLPKLISGEIRVEDAQHLVAEAL